MRTDIWYDSKGAGKIHGCRWTPEGEAKAVVQIVHGIAEFVERYDGFANYLTGLGFVVVAEDHMGHGQSIGKGSLRDFLHSVLHIHGAALDKTGFGNGLLHGNVVGMGVHPQMIVPLK